MVGIVFLSAVPSYLFNLNFLHLCSTVKQSPGVRELVNLSPFGDGDLRALDSLTTWNMQTFNARTPNVRGVRYYSWGTAFNPVVCDVVLWG